MESLTNRPVKVIELQGRLIRADHSQQKMICQDLQITKYIIVYKRKIQETQDVPSRLLQPRTNKHQGSKSVRSVSNNMTQKIAQSS